MRKVGPAGDDLKPDLAGKGVAEAKGVREVPEDGHPAVLEGLGRFQPSVPGELRRAGQLGPDRALHGLRVELAQFAYRPQGRARSGSPDQGGRHPRHPELVLQEERRRLPYLPVQEQIGPGAGEAAQVSRVSPERGPGVYLDPYQVEQPFGLGVLGRRAGAEDWRPEEVDRRIRTPLGRSLDVEA